MKSGSKCIWGIGALVVTVFAGRWGQGLFTTAEFVHFSINFPMVGNEPLMERNTIGGPWARIPSEKWKGIPAGGLLVFGREGRVTVDLGGRSLIKSLIQPNVLTLSSHWIRNVGTKSRGICIKANFCDFKVSYLTFEKYWDPSTKCSAREIAPGGMFNMDWIVDLPSASDKRINCDGSLEISDQKTKKLLTVLPVEIVDSSVDHKERN